MLTVFGADWSMTIWCDWSVRGLDLDCGSNDLEDWAWDLVGLSLTGFTVEAGWSPEFYLSGDLALVPDESDDEDPWVLDLSDVVITGGTRGPSGRDHLAAPFGRQLGYVFAHRALRRRAWQSDSRRSTALRSSTAAWDSG